MLKLGTWSSWDVPWDSDGTAETNRNLLNEALAYAQELVAPLGCRARKLEQLHDGATLGSVISYYTIEIDMPDDMDANEDHDDHDPAIDADDCEHCKAHDKLVVALNEAEETYQKRFEAHW